MSWIENWRQMLVFVSVVLCIGCTEEAAQDTYTGYVEADYVYVAAPQSGWLISQGPTEGTQVEKGDPLITLDADLQQAEKNEALAQLDEATASLRLAQAELARNKPLVQKGAISKSRFDDIETTADMASAALENAKARIAKADYQLSQRRIPAPRSGTVEEVFYRTGEFVAAGAPIYALLPDDGLKVRFFVPQSHLPRMAPGKDVELKVDGLADPVRARIFFIAREAEFTPPVIYSKDVRNKLVFLIEARLEDGASLQAGQPVTVKVP